MMKSGNPGGDEFGEHDEQNSAFEALEKDFQEVLKELVGDKSLDHFRNEYEKLHRALKQSHGSEKGLIKKCRELNGEIVSNAAKVQTALKLSQEDQHTISSLKKELERAWKMVETSHEKEDRAKETIGSLKGEIGSLESLVEDGAGLSMTQENAVNNLLHAKNDLTKHKDMLTAEVQMLSSQNTDLHEQVSTLETKKRAEEVQVEQLLAMLGEKKAEAERDEQRKHELEGKLKAMRAEVEGEGDQLKQLQGQSDKLHEQERQATADLMTQTSLVEFSQREKEQMDTHLRQRQDEYRSEQALKKRTEQSRDEAMGDLERVEAEVRAITRERDNALKQFNILQKDFNATAVTYEKNYAEVQQLRQGIDKVTDDLLVQKRFMEHQSKSIANVTREKDLLVKSMVMGDERSKQQVLLVERHAQRASGLDKDVQRWKSALNVTKKRVAELEQQRARSSAEIQSSDAKYQAALEELRNREQTLTDTKATIADVKQRLAQQKNLYELVRGTRNLYSKNLAESQDEIAEMKRKFKTMYHQVEQLKEEIKEKDQQIIKEHCELDKVTKNTQVVQTQLDTVERSQKNLQEQVDTMKIELRKLELVVMEADNERQLDKKNLEQVCCEKDVLGQQLIRRNDELRLLYEKIKIQQSTLQKGESQYRKTMDDVTNMRNSHSRLRTDLTLCQRANQFGDAMQQEVYRLEKELLHERSKVKALSEELEHPMNVHRWRKLESSDPTQFELIQKLKTLQKRLIGKTEYCVEKGVAIQEKDNECAQIKNVLARQPGPEIHKALDMYHDMYSGHKKNLEALDSELKVLQIDSRDYQEEMTRLTRELQEVRRKFFEHKKRTKKPAPQKIQYEPNWDYPRFTGGGFRLNQ